MLRQGDNENAIPSKNIFLSNVPLMQMLYKNDPLISKNCRERMELENFIIKDIIYVVGVIEEKRLRYLSMVYGRDYCASNDYITIKFVKK